MKERDLLKSQKACRQLDLSAGENNPVLEYFWPEIEKQKLLCEDEDVIRNDNSLVKENNQKETNEKPPVLIDFI